MKTYQNKTYRNAFRALSTAILFLALALSALPVLGAAGSATPTGVVNINEAGANLLVLLPRVGPALAQRIVEHREQNGKFKTPEDLMLVRGIGEKTFQLMAPFVTVSGKTTLTTKIRPSDLAEPAPEKPKPAEG